MDIFIAEHYLDAAQDWISDAKDLHRRGRYTSAIYLSGVGIECLLYAYGMKIDNNFKPEDDLQWTLRQSSVLEIASDKGRKKIGAALGELWGLWKRHYKYASGDRLVLDYDRRNILHNISGNKLEHASTQIIESALLITSLGRLKWES